MAASDLSWVPFSGRRTVTLGASLKRALRSRKGGPPPKKAVPTIDFFSLRCKCICVVYALVDVAGLISFLHSDNFQPQSIDPSKPGTIEVKKGKGSTGVTVERACTQVRGLLFLHRLVHFGATVAPHVPQTPGMISLSTAGRVISIA